MLFMSQSQCCYISAGVQKYIQKQHNNKITFAEVCNRLRIKENIILSVSLITFGNIETIYSTLIPPVCILYI